jgi:hypothetical protein
MGVNKLVLIITFLILSVNGFTQNQKLELREVKKIALKINLSDLLFHRYSLGFERKIGSSFSFCFDVDVLNKKMMLESNHPWDQPPIHVMKKGIILEPQMRWYFFNNELKGLYSSLAGYFGSAIYQTESSTLYNNKWSTIGGTLHLGYQLLLGRIIVDSFLGATLANDNYPVNFIESTALFPPPDGLRFSGGLKLGILF